MPSTKSDLRKKVNLHLGVKTKKEALQVIRYKIMTDDVWLLRAIKAIYDRQTKEEKETRETREHNGVGFSKFDANRMSKLAILTINGMGLTPTQMFTARQIMKKQKAAGLEAGLHMVKFTDLMCANTFIDKELGCVPLGVEADDIDAAIGQSVTLCLQVLDGKTDTIDMKGE